MKLSKLLTYSFNQNVGQPDRVFRILSGLALAALPWVGVLSLPSWGSVVMTVFGIAWFMTGVVSRCGMYYLLGYSTRKAESQQ